MEDFMKKSDRKALEQRIADIVADAYRADEETVREFLRRKVGRWLLATLLGEPGKPDMPKASAYLYKKARLDKDDIPKVEECYMAALIINEIRFIGKNIDRNVAKNWLKMSCSKLEDHVPICVIRDGRSYNHLTAVGAAKTFFFEVLK